jgi:hypothetical protein
MAPICPLARARKKSSELMLDAGEGWGEGDLVILMSCLKLYCDFAGFILRYLKKILY